MMLTRIPDLIISGGQSGADYGGLLGAEKCGIPTGGIAPRGFLTEDGPKPELGTRFGLVESKSANYEVRTRENVEMCQGIVLICRNFESPGSKLTKKLAFELKKPLFSVLFSPKASFLDPNRIKDVRIWLKMTAPGVLAVLGNRESKAPGIEKFTENLIKTLFG